MAARRAAVSSCRGHVIVFRADWPDEREAVISCREEVPETLVEALAASQLEPDASGAAAAAPEGVLALPELVIACRKAAPDEPEAVMSCPAGQSVMGRHRIARRPSFADGPRHRSSLTSGRSGRGRPILRACRGRSHPTSASPASRNPADGGSGPAAAWNQRRPGWPANGKRGRTRGGGCA